MALTDLTFVATQRIARLPGAPYYPGDQFPGSEFIDDAQAQYYLDNELVDIVTGSSTPAPTSIPVIDVEVTGDMIASFYTNVQLFDWDAYEAGLVWGGSTWQSGGFTSEGQVEIQPGPSDSNLTSPADRFFVVEIEGTQGVEEPNWSTAVNPGDLIVDGDATWRYLGTGAEIGLSDSRLDLMDYDLGPVVMVRFHRDGSVGGADDNQALPQIGYPYTGPWTADTQYDDPVIVTPAESNGHWYISFPGGTSGAEPPIWPTDGGNVVDGTVTWYDQGLVPPMVTLKPIPRSSVEAGMMHQVLVYRHYEGTTVAFKWGANAAILGYEDPVVLWPDPGEAGGSWESDPTFNTVTARSGITTGSLNARSTILGASIQLTNSAVSQQEAEDGSGVIGIKSPDGTEHVLTVTDAGVLEIDGNPV